MAAGEGGVGQDVSDYGDSSAAGPSRETKRSVHLGFHPLFPTSASLVCAALVLALVSPNLARSAQVRSSLASDTGRRIFASTCAACHGLDGRGGDHAPNISSSPEVQRLTDEQIFHIVHDGSASRAMPGFGTTFPAAQIRAVVQYLRVLQGARGAAKLPGDPVAGRAIFYGAGGCSTCHMVKGEGGFIAADLTDYASTKSPDEIRAAIVSPGADPGLQDRLAVVTTESGEKITGLVRNEDNFSIQLQSLDGAFHLLDKSRLKSVTYEADSFMPSDYSHKLSSHEIDAIVSFLMTTARATSVGSVAPAAKGQKHDD